MEHLMKTLGVVGCSTDQQRSLRVRVRTILSSHGQTNGTVSVYQVHCQQSNTTTLRVSTKYTANSQTQTNNGTVSVYQVHCQQSNTTTL